jgi:quercetin dioxygenase-like cupin family protein
MDADAHLNQFDSKLAELAALYALDIVDDTELDRAADLYEQDAAFATIVDQDRAAASLMAYGAAKINLPTSLKDRLFQRIATEPALKLSAAELEKLKREADRATWAAYEPTPGAEVATLEVNEVSREFRGFVRSPGQAKFPEHRHAGDEELIVVDGELVIGDQVYFPGDRILSQPGTQHQPETATGVLLFLCTSIDDEMFVD